MRTRTSKGKSRLFKIASETSITVVPQHGGHQEDELEAVDNAEAGEPAGEQAQLQDCNASTAKRWAINKKIVTHERMQELHWSTEAGNLEVSMKEGPNRRGRRSNNRSTEAHNSSLDIRDRHNSREKTVKPDLTRAVSIKPAQWDITVTLVHHLTIRFFFK
jgi:hypothetical protein